MRDKNYFMH
uniref:Uncharacterized protein n=1 Tax=Rhizophora mucronata TaxID=61149 RepID=A0A2P2MUQ2_RHIMU